MRVGIIGRGFGARVVAPAYEATEGCEVVDVLSPRDDAAVAQLCARDDVDLISVHSPPFMHVDHVSRAIDAGKAVLCDKPFGRNAAEAQQMHDLADAAGVVNLLNFEMRCEPANQLLRRLVLDGSVGTADHYRYSALMSVSRVPLRRYGWLFDAERGGGWLGAAGSHAIDYVRWCFGEVVHTTGSLRVAITERPDGEGGTHKCSGEDGYTAVLHTEGGVNALLDSTSTAPVMSPLEITIIGSEGMLSLQMPESNILLQRTDGSSETFGFETGVPLLHAQTRWAAVVREAVESGETPPDAPTFADGLATAQVMDALRQASS